MPAVSVRKRMDNNETMMEADHEFVGRVSRMFNPIAGIAELDREAVAHLVNRDADVLLCPAILSRPPPGLVEHARVQLPQVDVGNHFDWRSAIFERPRARAKDVL